ncbi:GDP-mannose-dependent alpha-mannosyltransferase [Sphaerisporangium krabiense]|uniref:Phosphatidylinositol alpha 1,6-mannosyltransferase n=1 Tax=Sphaerisporangium krabiense TaxID=763782 RepID=A0A7W8Z7T9_9ACTN|nr:glycosyltransferase family 1 protein [Sphaerisporangium krabiense]MBB5628925.1 phosphatidylinositol alpha 1,6-mannosyltransferase [Sphaerisporangium krabiense]GII60234.1 GDP-mannose-dependent alpha-mannosyltransferase [Sphaerisporangium krabiense]
MRVAIVSESFLPQVNGVTNSLCRLLDHLAEQGHDAMVVAPNPGPRTYAGFPVHATPAFRLLPFYRSFRVGLPSRVIHRSMAEFKPDVVHLASPTVVGAAGLTAALRLGVPAVAVFQTDLAGFARQYGLRGTDALIWSWLRHVHARAALTLAPSTATMRELRAHGVPRVSLWGRGVDLDLFHPRHRSPELRRELAPDGEVVVGYVGRLAADKRVHLLAELAGLPGVRLVVVGDGPAERRLRALLPGAVFCGLRTGTDLARVLASFDVFVHTGRNETYCQAVQEALAAGVPVVAAAAGGPLDLVTPGENGLLFPPDDPAAMRAAVARLAGDAALRRRMGLAARASVLGRSWTSLCHRLFGYYQAVVGEPATVPAAWPAGTGGGQRNASAWSAAHWR